MDRIGFEYPGPPLRLDRKEIRVLELLPTAGLGGLEVSCLLHIVSLLTRPKPRFSALSYVWGSTSETKSILVNGRLHDVTKNLAVALRFFTAFRQDRLRDFRLWADAICINQSTDPENHERDEQVAMMGDIFADADEVLSWLGDNARIPKALNTLVMLHKESNNAISHTKTQDDTQWLTVYPELFANDAPGNETWLLPSQTCLSMHDFLELPYWSRMWVFQEIVLAKPDKLIFVTPIEPYVISGDDLRLALGLIDAFGQQFLKQARPDYLTQAMLEHLEPLRTIGNACKHINRLLVARRRFNDNELSQADSASLCILTAFRYNTRATNPLDYYYSLLGVSRLDLKPDYTATNHVETVCVDFVGAYLGATLGSPYTLLFLHDALGREAKAHGLPSWAPRYHLPHTMQGRERGIDWKADADRNVFEVSPGVSGFKVRLEGRTLLTEGVRIGAEQLVSDQPVKCYLTPGATDSYLLDFERRNQGRYVTGIPSATAYFATLVADEDGQHEGWTSRIALRALSGFSGEDSAQERETWHLLKQVFLRSIQETVLRGEEEVSAVDSEWSRTFVQQGVPRTSRLFEFEGGYLGLALQDVENGDAVCVLNGSQYPVILRPLPDDLSEFVGTCFVLGLMKGEARAYLSTGRRIFHII